MPGIEPAASRRPGNQVEHRVPGSDRPVSPGYTIFCRVTVSCPVQESNLSYLVQFYESVLADQISKDRAEKGQA